MSETEEPAFTRSSGNPFADLGLPDADLRLAKARLAQQVTAVMRERGLTQAEIAAMMGIDQPQVSRITRGQLRDFSLEKLLELVRRLGVGVDIHLTRPAEPAQPARLVVHAPEAPLAAHDRQRAEPVRVG
jgi:predicted XRE-type DNA-binding protein